MTEQRDAPASAPGGSMSLLVDMATAALDPGYADAARRRAAGAGAPSGAAPAGRPRAVSAVVAALLLAAGVTAGVAVAQVRLKAGEAGAVHRSLVAEVRRQTQVSDQLADQVAALRQEVASVQNRALGEGALGRTAARQLEQVELATGVRPVQGPGLLVRLDDADGSSTDTSGSGARGGQLGDGRIYDRDLQDVVNALWQAGAEAIAVNGQRLTAQTAIRSAGEAILVDFRPLSPPYLLSAVGPVDTMEPAFVDGAVARRFQTWTSLYGLGFAVSRARLLHLPAAGSGDLHLVRTTGTGG